MNALLVLALAIASTDAGASEDWLAVEARVEVPDGGVSVGQPFRVIIEATHPPGGIALLPEELSLDAKLAERRAARRHVRAGSKAKEIDRYELEVLPFEAGALEVPSIPLAYGSTRAATPALSVEVATGFTEEELPVATSTLPEAIEELEKMAAQDPSAKVVLVEDYLVLWLAGGAVVLGFVAFVLWRVLRGRTREQAAAGPPPPPPRPAHEVALERFAALRKAGYLERGELKTFYAEVSEILRAYAGGRYGFDSLDLTVSELMAEIARVHAPGLDARKLEEILDASDLVKFAKFTPLASDAATALDAAEEIVHRTKPAEAPRPEGGA